MRHAVKRQRTQVDAVNENRGAAVAVRVTASDILCADGIIQISGEDLERLVADVGGNLSLLKTMKKSALDAMVAEAAKLAKQMGFSKSEVDRRIWTHAEAGSMLDGGRNRPNSKNTVTPPPAPDNYGPYGGDSARVDWMDVDQQSWGQKKGGSVLRSMIKNRMYYGGKVSGAKGQDMIPVMLTHGEFILDVNSTKAMEDNFPGFLDALNRAKYDQAIGVLRNYASYEAGAQQSAQIPMTIINNIIQSQDQKSSGGVMMMPSGGSADDYGEALAAGQ